MFRPFAIAALAAAIASPVLAQDAAPVTLAAWSARVEKALSHTITYPTRVAGREVGSGVVRVRFSCSESGRPDRVSLYQSSHDPELDRLAVRAVSRMATLHPLPDGMTHGQQYVATILYARDRANYAAQVRQLRAAAVKGNAWFGGPTAIALLDDGGGAAN